MANWDDVFRKGAELASEHYFHAAIEVWSSLVQDGQTHTSQLSELYNELGKARVQIGLNQEAMRDFGVAVAHAPTLERKVGCEINLAMTYRRNFEYDKAQRMLTQLMQFSPQLSPAYRAILHANLAVVQGLNGFYAVGLENTQLSLQFFELANIRTYHSTLHNNLGALYSHLGDFARAESCLLSSLNEENGPHLSTISELSRLYIQQGAVETSLEYAHKALPFVWTSIMSYDKDDIATLCLLLAQLSRHVGQAHTALRLLDKAQLFYGQLGLWREWQQIQQMVDTWPHTSHPVAGTFGREYRQQIQQFAVLLDAIHSQELIHPRFPQLLDARVLFAQALATRLQIDAESQKPLLYACRFADYGLTAIEPDVIQSPERSQHSLGQYRLHSALGVDMLRELTDLPSEVWDIVLHHHERFDGAGYPSGQSGREIPHLAQVLAVADCYANAVVLRQQSHSAALAEVQFQQGTAFDPHIARAFLSLF
jgi:tetratricopeptide (TPR) repeat protein